VRACERFWSGIFVCGSGLTDGIFSNRNYKFGLILEGLAIEDGVGIIWKFGLFYGHFIYFLPFDTFCSNLVYFSCFGTLYQGKSGNPDLVEVPFNIFQLFFGGGSMSKLYG
jgi:hypothetical protein